MMKYIRSYPVHLVLIGIISAISVVFLTVPMRLMDNEELLLVLASNFLPLIMLFTVTQFILNWGFNPVTMAAVILYLLLASFIFSVRYIDRKGMKTTSYVLWAAIVGLSTFFSIFSGSI